MSVQIWEADEKHAWITDYLPAGVGVADAMDEIRQFAYSTFEYMDKDSDGFIDRLELQDALNLIAPQARERSFVLFLLFHLNEIAAAFTEECITRSDGISKDDLEAYFIRFRRKYS
jgi:Ca2+-binding EF-hand superfamily protein